jgi:hypothetical protein
LFLLDTRHTGFENNALQPTLQAVIKFWIKKFNLGMRNKEKHFFECDKFETKQGIFFFQCSALVEKNNEVLTSI